MATVQWSDQQFSIGFDRLGINSQTGMENGLKHVNKGIFNLFMNIH